MITELQVGLTYEVHEWHDDDVFYHEPTPECACGPQVIEQNAVPWVGAYVKFLHPVLTLKAA